jgi:HEPN domain-containing protein
VRLVILFVTTRYPNSIPASIPARIYTKKAAKEVELAEEIVEFVKTTLGFHQIP